VNIGLKSAISLQRRPVDPKFRVEGVAPTNHSYKTKLNGLSYGIKIWTDLTFCHNAHVWQTERRTDRRTDRIFIARPRLHCI